MKLTYEPRQHDQFELLRSVVAPLDRYWLPESWQVVVCRVRKKLLGPHNPPLPAAPPQATHPSTT